jgi:hypothetical protein
MTARYLSKYRYTHVDKLARITDAHLMLMALTPAGGVLANVFFSREVMADYREHTNTHGFEMSYKEWCGIAPFRRDPDLVWC